MLAVRFVPVVPGNQNKGPVDFNEENGMHKILNIVKFCNRSNIKFIIRTRIMLDWKGSKERELDIYLYTLNQPNYSLILGHWGFIKCK